jgi:N-acetylneuraminate synthase
MNLRTIPWMQERFQVPVGLSDHTLGIAAPVAAVALGACVVEKHFTLSRSDPGPDSAFSLEPAEFKAMVDAIRVAEKALGTPALESRPEENKSRVFRRSLFVVKDIKAGQRFTADNIRSIRPGYGLHTRCLQSILNQVASTDIARGTPMKWEFVVKDSSSDK